MNLSSKLEVTTSHPACFSKSIIRSLCSDRDCCFEDIDSLNQQAMEMEKEIEELDTWNFLQLMRLQQRFKTQANCESLREHRERLRDILCTLSNAFTRRALPSYLKKPKTESSTISENGIPASVSSLRTGSGATTGNVGSR